MAGANWLDRVLAAMGAGLAGYAWYNQDSSLAITGLVLAVLLTVMGAILAGGQHHHPDHHWFATRGHWSWPIGLSIGVLATALSTAVRATLDEPQLEGYSIAILSAGWALSLFFFATGAMHHARFRLPVRDGDELQMVRLPMDRMGLRLLGTSLVGLGWLFLTIGGVTVLDPSSADYWYFGGLAIPLALLGGAGIWALSFRTPAKIRIVDS